MRDGQSSQCSRGEIFLSLFVGASNGRHSLVICEFARSRCHSSIGRVVSSQSTCKENLQCLKMPTARVEFLSAVRPARMEALAIGSAKTIHAFLGS
jgi:hypothetical protein